MRFFFTQIRSILISISRSHSTIASLIRKDQIKRVDYGHIAACVPRCLSKIRAATQSGGDTAGQYSTLSQVVCHALITPPPSYFLLSITSPITHLELAVAAFGIPPRPATGAALSSSLRFLLWETRQGFLSSVGGGEVPLNAAFVLLLSKGYI